MKRMIVAAGIVVVAAVAVLVWAPGSIAAQDARLTALEPQVHLIGGGGSALGVTVRDVTSDDVAKAKLDGARGVVIESVREGTPASQAGLRSGDIVLEFDGERVRSVQQFTRLVQETTAGRSVNAVVMRDGSRQTIAVTPEQRGRVVIDDLISRRVERSLDRVPRNFALVPEIRTLVSPRQLGATLTPLSDQLEGYFGVGNGVLVSSVETDSTAFEAGLRAGDVITQVNGRRVENPNDVSQTVRSAAPGSTVDITVTREKKELMLKARIPDASPSGRRGVAL
jgi:serine protease Do